MRRRCASSRARSTKKALFQTFSRKIIGKTDNAHRVYYETINVRYTLVQSTCSFEGEIYLCVSLKENLLVYFRRKICSCIFEGKSVPVFSKENLILYFLGEIRVQSCIILHFSILIYLCPLEEHLFVLFLEKNLCLYFRRKICSCILKRTTAV